MYLGLSNKTLSVAHSSCRNLGSTYSSPAASGRESSVKHGGSYSQSTQLPATQHNWATGRRSWAHWKLTVLRQRSASISFRSTPQPPAHLTFVQIYVCDCSSRFLLGFGRVLDDPRVLKIVTWVCHHWLDTHNTSLLNVRTKRALYHSFALYHTVVSYRANHGGRPAYY